MAADPVVPYEVAQLAEYLLERQLGVMTIQLGELAALMKPAKNVRAVPAQRWAGESLLLTAANKSDYQVIGRRADAMRIRLVYLGSAEATALDVIRVGHASDVVRAATYSACRVLNANVRELVLEVNDADIWIGLGAEADGDTGELVSWTVEEFDPNAIG